MDNFGLSFHHLALAINKDTHAVNFLEGLGYQFGAKVYDPIQNVHLQLCEATGHPTVELITPGHGDGPLTPILKRYNELIYHICYTVNNRSESLYAMESASLRIKCVSEPKPAVLFRKKHVSFYQVIGFGLIELLET